MSRSLQACEGALLVVDASQGEAQTLAVCIWRWKTIWRSFRCSTRSIPRGRPDRIKEEIEAIVGLDCDNAIPVPRRPAWGFEILQAVVDRVLPRRMR